MKRLVDRTKFRIHETPEPSSAYVSNIRKQFPQRVSNMIAKTFDALSPAQQRITKRMREMGFGKIRNLSIINGEPILKGATVTTR